MEIPDDFNSEYDYIFYKPENQEYSAGETVTSDHPAVNASTEQALNTDVESACHTDVIKSISKGSPSEAQLSDAYEYVESKVMKLETVDTDFDTDLQDSQTGFSGENNSVTKSSTSNLDTLKVKLRISKTARGKKFKSNDDDISSGSSGCKDNTEFFDCTECGKVLRSLRAFENHKNLHSGKYKCELCEKVLNSETALKNHAKIHEGYIGSHLCKVCDKTFFDSSSLTRHTRSVHMGIKNFQCKFCTLSFFAEKTLVEHERVHTGERPFKCDQCPKSFKRISDFNHHLRMHKGWLTKFIKSL